MKRIRFRWELMAGAVILSILLFSVINPVSGGTETAEISLEESLELVVEHDLDYRIALREWEKALIDQKISSLYPPETEEERITEEIRVRRSQEEFEKARRDVITGITAQYFDLQFLKKQFEIRELEYALAADEYDVVKRKVETGQLPERDLLEEKSSYRRSKLNLKQAERDYGQAREEFLQAIGKSTDFQRVLLTTPVPEPVIELSYEEVVELASRDQFVIWEREARIRLSEIDLERLRTQDAGFLEIDRAENDHQITLLAAEKMQKAHIQNLLNRWTGLKDSLQEIELAEIELQVAREHYERSTRQFAAGLLPESRVTRDLIALMRAESGLLRDTISFLAGSMTLRGELGLELLSSESRLDPAKEEFKPGIEPPVPGEAEEGAESDGN